MKVAAYYRVSSLAQNLEMQQEAVREFCRRKGWEPREFSDKISGAKWTRIGLESLMADVRSGRIQVVVCYKLDRLGRSLSHMAQLIEELAKHDVAVVSVSEGIDTSADSPTARLQLNIMLIFAQFERELIRERVVAGISAAKARGQRLGRPRSAKGEGRVLELKAAGKGVREIARELAMSPATVFRMLRRSISANAEALCQPETANSQISTQDSGFDDQRLS